MEKNNEVFFRGRLGQDAQQIKGHTKFSIAVWRGKDKPSMWLDVFAPNKMLTIAKGTEVKVSGRLDFQEWEGKIKYQVIASDVSFNDDDFLEE